MVSKLHAGVGGDFIGFCLMDKIVAADTKLMKISAPRIGRREGCRCRRDENEMRRM